MEVLQHPMMAMFLPERWFQKRDEEMEYCRKNMAVLTDPNGFWKYDRRDPRVLKANAHCIERARRCHAIAMGRVPLIKNFIVADESGAVKGDLYV
jgi:hypothetical protein